MEKNPNNVEFSRCIVLCCYQRKHSHENTKAGNILKVHSLAPALCRLKSTAHRTSTEEMQAGQLYSTNKENQTKNQTNSPAASPLQKREAKPNKQTEDQSRKHSWLAKKSYQRSMSPPRFLFQPPALKGRHTQMSGTAKGKKQHCYTAVLTALPQILSFFKWSSKLILINYKEDASFASVLIFLFKTAKTAIFNSLPRSSPTSGMTRTAPSITGVAGQTAHLVVFLREVSHTKISL